MIFTTEELGELASSEEEGTRVAGKSPGRNQDTWGGAPGLHDPGKPFPISGPQFPRAPQGIWAGQRPETPRPSRQWPEQLSGFASQRAAATGQGSDPDCHGACRATPRRAGALTARRDAKPTNLRGRSFLVVAILAQLPPQPPAESHVTADCLVGVPPPLGRGFWSDVMTPYRGSVSSF